MRDLGSRSRFAPTISRPCRRRSVSTLSTSRRTSRVVGRHTSRPAFATRQEAALHRGCSWYDVYTRHAGGDNPIGLRPELRRRGPWPHIRDWNEPRSGDTRNKRRDVPASFTPRDGARVGHARVSDRSSPWTRQEGPLPLASDSSSSGEHGRRRVRQFEINRLWSRPVRY
jgi:hypothetical protein